MGCLRSIIVITLLCAFSFAGDSKPKTVGEGVEQAAKRSQLTLPGSQPFHLKATIAELNSPDTDYKAEVEMYWVAPGRWRRILKSPDFSQTMVVDGEKVFEQNQGDYFPWWLNDFVIAMLQLAPEEIRQIKMPLPDLAAMQKEFAKKLPPGLAGLRMDTGTQCMRSQEEVGIAPVHNTIFTVVCFQNPGSLQSVVSPGFEADFSDFKNFGGKSIARKISMEPESGTKIEARVTELSELNHPDPALFVIQDSGPQTHIARMRVSEGVARAALQSNPEIEWLPVRDGKIKGTLSLFVSIGRDGHVRETWPLNSDNPFPQDQARKVVSQWTFKPFLMNGAPVQVETILTFGFATKIGNPVNVLTDAEARALAIDTAEPEFVSSSKPSSGTSFKVRVAVDEEGHVMGLKNIDNLNMQLLGAANVALHKWRFRPYVHEGKPDRFDADIVFKVQ
ncbi:MAG TPA: energy transducer TonB [Candidatus Angelobacter sp.]|nr:energy transducer TonB [Candidatus Angelobacter sp.]